jgi:hypothetical protein
MTEQVDIAEFNQEQIKEILDECSIQYMLYYYKLTAEFCVKYILTTDEYAASIEDTYFDLYDVLRYQPHLSMKEIKETYKKLGFV